MINGNPGIVIYYGPMFSGKSDELITEANRAEYGHQEVLAIVPRVGSRLKNEGVIASRQLKEDGKKTERVRSYPAHLVDDEDLTEIEFLIEKNNPDVLIIDEAHFFYKSVEQLEKIVLDAVWAEKVRVYLAGLNLDVFNNKFSWVCELLPRSDEVHSLSAVCFVDGCAHQARHTQLIAPEVEISEENPFQVGDKGTYEARCRTHWCHPKEIKQD